MIGLEHQLAKRKKWIGRFVVGAFVATVVAVWLAYRLSPGRRQRAPSLPETVPSDIHSQSSGYTFTRSDAGRQIFTVHAARTVALKQSGTMMLEDVVVEFFGRTDNRHDLLRTRRGEYNAEAGYFFSGEKAEIELNAAGTGRGVGDGQTVFVETSGISMKLPGVISTDQPVRFRVGPASGSARGLLYTPKDKCVQLKSDVTGELHFKQPGEMPLQLAASQARYDRIRNEITFGGPITIIQGTRRVVADGGVVALDSQNRPLRASLQGNVKGVDSSPERSLELSASQIVADFDPASRQVRHAVAQFDVVSEMRRGGVTDRLASQKLDVDLAPGPRPQPRSARASGNAELTIGPATTSHSPPKSDRGAPPAVSADKKILTAPEMRFAFRPDGRSLASAETLGSSKLVLIPLDSKSGRRTITAGQFLMAFNSRNRLESLRGSAPTHLLLEPPLLAPPGSVPQETFSDTLEARFDGATGAVRSFEQSGKFRFREGDRQATSERADYSAENRLLTLTGGRPLVWDSTMRVRADQIRFDLGADTAEGQGHIQGSHFAPPDPSGAADHRPAQSSGEGDPTNVLADRMRASRRDQVVHYEGYVRAWNGTDSIESTALDLYRDERRLSSGFRVLTSFLRRDSAKDAASQASAPGSRSATVRADHLEYWDEERKASYRGNVELLTGDTTLKADRLEVFLSEAGAKGKDPVSEIERAVADGNVTVTEPGRRGASEHADYDAAEGKIVLTGGSPVLYDERKGLTTGRRLTFYTRDDRLSVDGENKSPTLSKHRVAQ